MNILVIGSEGYLGSILVKSLIKDSHKIVGIDLKEYSDNADLRYYSMDACNYDAVYEVIKDDKFDVIIHLATALDFAVKTQKELYDNNLGCTRTVCELAKKLSVPKVIFISSNSVYAGNKFTEPFSEDITPIPIDEYGKSKLDSEKLFLDNDRYFNTVIIRSPIIIDASRVGMLSIFFEFILENRKCWVVAGGKYRHQCIYAGDLVDAIKKSLNYNKSNVFNIGSDNVQNFKDMYQAVIKHAGSKSTTPSVPYLLSIPPLKLANFLGLSPMGKYQFRMLTSDFIFDTTRIKKELNWKPTLSNSEMLSKAYDYYIKNRDELSKNGGKSANSSPVKMGILNILKKLS